MEFLWAFLVGGAICAIAQILIDKTRLTAGRILVIYVCVGAFLTLIGVYEPLVEFAGAGATVPLSGFGYALATGAMEQARADGWLGAIRGGLMATSAGVAAAILFGYLGALVAKPKDK